MTKLFISLVAFLIVRTVSAQQGLFNATLIPEKLKTGANAVKRLEEISFEVSDIEKAKLKVHEVYTILNKEGNAHFFFNQTTNKFRSLSDVEIRLYDASGKEVSKYRKKDLIKEARNQELVEEGMYHYIQLTAPSYPATVEFSYQLNYSGTLFYPQYEVQAANEGVESTSMTVKVPKELGLRFRQQNIDLKPVIADEGKNMIYTWTAKDLVPFKYETGAVAESDLSPSIVLAPNKFQFYNTSGEMTSWKSFGQWEQNLLQNLEVLPDERKAFFINMVKDVKTEKEKITIIYHYLQENFRYVSIQLGIGGFRPFPASFTDQKKYGDCKGLSFYMYSVLKSIGIRSYVALVNAKYNNPPVDPSFPEAGFNHMILCVPQKNDSIWLECTSKTTEFNFLGSYTENRNALLITENGGVLVPTPKSKASSNIMNVVTHIQLNEDGSGKTKTVMHTKGFFNELVAEVESAKKEDQKSYIVNEWGFKQPDEFSITKRDKGNENTEIDLDLEKIPQFTAGSKMFLNPRIYSPFGEILPVSEGRKYDYYFNSCYEISDTTVYQLPVGYAPDVIPAAIDKTCKYASYSTSYTYNKEKNELESNARLVLNQNRIPAAGYADVKKFFDSVLSDNTQKLVIKKN